MVIVDGVQRVRPGMVVRPAPAGRRPPCSAPPAVAAGARATARRQRPMISAVFVDRPRLAIVIAIVITIAGALAMLRIPVAQFPDIVPPQVTVTATYPGASAAVVESAVAQPLEAQVVGVDKMIYMKSNSGNDGSYTLTVSFELGTNPDIDTVNVNNRVQTALSQLPPEVQHQGLTVPEALHRDPAVPGVLQRRTEAGPAVHQQLRDDQRAGPAVAHPGRRPGEPVRQAELLDADLVRHRPADRLEPGAVRHHRRDPAQNVLAPIGRIGARPIGDDQQFQFNVQTQGRLTTPEEFGAIVLRANPDGSVLRLRDVARVELGAQNMDSESRLNGRPGVPIGIYLAPGANAVRHLGRGAGDAGRRCRRAFRPA